MPRPKTAPVAEKKTAKEIREEVRQYITKERDTILIKWMALEEQVKAEDYRRENFYKRREREDTKTLPINIQKFINTMKRAVRKIVRHKGGTAYSIIRDMFNYWDADKSGAMSASEMRNVMNTIGCYATDAQLEEVVAHYDTGHRQEGVTDIEMDYQELLRDVSMGEPTLIEFGDYSHKSGKSGHAKEDDGDGPRFDEIVEDDTPMPRVVEQFLEAVRNWVMMRMRVDGGTPYHHVRFIFNFYDYDYSNGLNVKELMTATRKGMHLAMSEEQAKAIIAYYDRWRREGQMRYEEFLADVCADVKPVLYTFEQTPAERQAKIRSLNVNPFMPVPFKSPANKIVEDFKKNISVALNQRMNAVGGTVTSWLTDSFVRWDRKLTRKINDHRVLQGAAKMLNVILSEEEAMAIMARYDKWGTGEMHYLELIKDLTDEEGDFLKEVEDSQQSVTAQANNSSTARCPPHVQRSIDLFRASLDVFCSKSGGVLQPRDLLHGSLMRYDTERAGRVTAAQLISAARDLNVQLMPKEVKNIMLWFDTNGTNQLDYNAFTKQMFGEDVQTKRLQLPKLNKQAGNSNYNVTNLFDSSRPDTISDDSAQTLKVQTKVMLLAESHKVRKQRLDAKRAIVFAERKQVKEKLRSIEEQKNQLLSDYRMRKETEKRENEEKKRLKKMADDAAKVREQRGGGSGVQQSNY